MFDLRCELYDSILRMSASFFDRNKSGSIVARLISDIQLAQDLVGNALTVGRTWIKQAASNEVIRTVLLQESFQDLGSILDGWRAHRCHQIFIPHCL
jgi:ABC-type multidrug transport system fused ATPase/permease subunit